MKIKQAENWIIPNPGGQTEFLNDWDNKFVSLVGGLRSGKTFAGVIKLILCLLYNNFSDGKFRNKYINALIVAQSFATLRDAVIYETLLPLLEKFNISATLKQQKQQIVLDDLSTKNQQTLIYLRSAVNAPDLKGFEVGCFLLDECGSYTDNWEIPQKDAILQSIGRLAAPDAKLLQGYFCGSPEGTHSRWYKMFFREDNKECKAYTASSRDNPYVQEAVKSNELIYTEQLRKSYIDGIFVDISGSNTYFNFTKNNIDDNLKLNNSQPLHISCDFGSNPGNVLIIGQETKELLFTTHEIHGTKMQTKEAMVELKKLIDEHSGFPELHFFGDTNGNHAKGEEDFSSYIIMQNYAHKWGIPSIVKTLGRNPLVKDRINAVNNNLQNIHNKIHWKCHPRCTGLINDFKNVSWDMQGKKLIKTPELSHWSDAEGYRIHYLRQIVREQEPMNYGRFNV